MKFGIHVCNDFGDPLTLHLKSQSYILICLIMYIVLNPNAHFIMLN